MYISKLCNDSVQITSVEPGPEKNAETTIYLHKRFFLLHFCTQFLNFNCVNVFFQIAYLPICWLSGFFPENSRAYSKTRSNVWRIGRNFEMSFFCLHHALSSCNHDIGVLFVLFRWNVSTGLVLIFFLKIVEKVKVTLTFVKLLSTNYPLIER